jgi:hypothetical protein
MSWHGEGNRPVNSSASVIAAGSTSTLYAELDSTRLGTVGYSGDQSVVWQVTYVMGADTNVTWQVGPCTSTALNAGAADEFFVKTPTGQSAQYVAQHELKKDYRIRIRQQSSGAGGSAFLSAVPLL